MPTLLVSKVNNIAIIQVGESKLTVRNKSQNADKVGGFSGSFGGIGFSGQNKTVDIGKGRKEVSLKVFVDDRGDNDALFDILYNDRFCTIVDKFKGKIKVYVDSVTVTDSDKHVDRTIFDINATVQDLDKATSVNYTQQLGVVNNVIKDEKLKELWAGLKDAVVGVEDTVEYVNGEVKFTDTALQKLVDGIEYLMDVRTDVNDVYNQVSRAVDSTRSVKDIIVGLIQYPSAFFGMVLELTDDISNIITPPKSSRGKGLRLTDEVDDVSYNEGATSVTIVPITHPQVRGENLEDVDVDTLSQIEKEDLRRQIICANIVNNIKLSVDINSLLKGGFASRDDFELVVSEALNRLNYVGYSSDEISYVTYMIKSYAHQQQYKNLITVDITIAKPLVRIVYDRYGNLDNYMRIETLNNFKDNDYVVGDIRLFA